MLNVQIFFIRPSKKKHRQQVSFEPRDVEQPKPTSVVPREGVPGYWSHQLLESQVNFGKKL